MNNKIEGKVLNIPKNIQSSIYSKYCYHRFNLCLFKNDFISSHIDFINWFRFLSVNQ